MGEQSQERNRSNEDTLNAFESALNFLRTNFRAILVVALAAGATLFLLWLGPDLRLRLWVGLLSNRVLITLLLLFGLIAVSLLWSTGDSLDTQVFLYFNRHQLRSPWLDRFMWAATQIGNGLTSLLLSGAFYLVDHPRLAVELAFGTLTLWLVVETIKALAWRSRPFLSLSEAKVVGRRAWGRSFPSGHSSQAFFLAALLVFYFQLGILPSLLVYLFAMLVGFTRVYIGVHYPRDVLAGAVMGAIWGVLISLVDPYLVSRFP